MDGGRWRIETIRGSGGTASVLSEVSSLKRGSGGARETALASMRFGNSSRTGSYWRFGMSDEHSEDQPGCSIWSHDFICASEPMSLFSCSNVCISSCRTSRGCAL